jgi:sugar phosphate isomerase/epimerase
MTREAGLRVAAYGSYFQLGRSERQGLAFARVLDTAMALEAPLIRVWAGAASKDTDEAGRIAIASEARRIGDLAAAAGIQVAFEYHGGTLMDTDDSALALLQAVNHAAVGTLWQPHNGVAAARNLEGLRQILPWVRNAHVFHWGATPAERLPLAAGATVWQAYLALLRHTGRHHFALLEFVAANAPEAYLRDAATLGEWLAADTGHPTAGSP